MMRLRGVARGSRGLAFVRGRESPLPSPELDAIKRSKASTSRAVEALGRFFGGLEGVLLYGRLPVSTTHTC